MREISYANLQNENAFLSVPTPESYIIKVAPTTLHSL